MPRLLLPPHKAFSTPTELENGKHAAAERLLLCDLTCHQKKSPEGQRMASAHFYFPSLKQEHLMGST